MDATERVLNALTNAVGNMAMEATGREVVLADEDEIPKPEGEFILVDLTGLDQATWATNEWADSQGSGVITHNYEVVFTITAYRGNAHAAISKMLQSYNHPFQYEKHFPTGSPFAYASSSTISRIRVPLNMQKFENRSIVLLTFNVCFIEAEVGSFEDLQKIGAQLVYYYPSDETQP